MNFYCECEDPALGLLALHGPAPGRDRVLRSADRMAFRGIMRQTTGRKIQTVVLLSRWLILPFLLGMACCLLLIIYRLFADLYGMAVQLTALSWHDLIVGILYLVDLTLTANLVLIVIFAAFETYIYTTPPDEYANWPDGVTQVDFSILKQKLLGSIAGIAAVDALAWYLDLEKYSDTSKLGWALAFPLMFGAAMMMIAVADRLGRQSDK
jgi:uncharacterized protein (TIGR00645 family)